MSAAAIRNGIAGGIFLWAVIFGMGYACYRLSFVI
jgi:hypothetical protein